MKASAELPPLLWPFRASEVYASTLNGPCFVFAEPAPPRAALIFDDIQADRLDLQAALKFARRPRLTPIQRQRAAEQVVAIRAALIRNHLRLRELSVGFRAAPSAPVHLWP